METPAALNRTVQFQAAMIEELFEENYNFLLTPRFESEALETRCGIYWQINGASFLVSTKYFEQSEKTMKIKALIGKSFKFTSEINTTKRSQKNY